MNTEANAADLPTEMELQWDIEMLRMEIAEIEAKPRARAPLVRRFRAARVKTLKEQHAQLTAQLKRGEFAPDYAAMRSADICDAARAAEALDACYDV